MCVGNSHRRDNSKDNKVTNKFFEKGEKRGWGIRFKK